MKLTRPVQIAALQLIPGVRLTRGVRGEGTHRPGRATYSRVQAPRGHDLRRVVLRGDGRQVAELPVRLTEAQSTAVPGFVGQEPKGAAWLSTAPISGGSVRGQSPSEVARSKGRLLPACATLSRAQSNKEMKLTRPVQIAALQLISRVRWARDRARRRRHGERARRPGRVTTPGALEWMAAFLTALS
jgi:hypothetical protein